MNKKVIRLTESDLHRIVKESVNKILKESAYDINSLEYKQMYDSGDKWYDDREDADTRKEISNYEALPDKTRHPYGSEIPDLSDRIKNRPRKVKSSDKLASKEPNSTLRLIQDKQKQKEIEETYKQAMQNWLFKRYARENGIDLNRLSKKDIAYEFDYFLTDMKDKNSWEDFDA